MNLFKDSIIKWQGDNCITVEIKQFLAFLMLYLVIPLLFLFNVFNQDDSTQKRQKSTRTAWAAGVYKHVCFGRMKVWIFKCEEVRNQENHRSEDRRSED